MKEDADLKRLKSVMLGAKNAVVFTGAGVSVPSGIPDFRSAGGVYDGKFAGYPAEYMLSHDCLVTRPELFFDFYKTKMIYPSAKPNAAHLFFAELERRGKLLSVVTQNIDGLHQDAGSERVWELHGSVRRNRCEGCGASYDEKFVLASEGVPKCPKCGGRVRPCVVLYGENLDSDVLDGAVRDISRADVLLIAGTSLAVCQTGIIRTSLGAILFGAFAQPNLANMYTIACVPPVQHHPKISCSEVRAVPRQPIFG